MPWFSTNSFPTAKSVRCISLRRSIAGFPLNAAGLVVPCLAFRLHLSFCASPEGDRFTSRGLTRRD